MLRYFLGLSVLTVGLNAWSYPHVGDKVKWEGAIRLKTGLSKSVYITKEVVGYDEVKKKWTVKYVATVGDQVTTEFLETSELYTPEKHKSLIANCESQGGRLEKLTAPAGTYQTCKMTSRNTDGVMVEKWWGDIPFGVVGRNTTDSGENVNPDLNALARGL